MAVAVTAVAVVRPGPARDDDLDLDLDADDAIPFSEDDLAELAEELRLQMPPGLAPEAMGKLAYCLVMTTLLTSWTAVVLAVPQVGTLATITGGPSLVTFHKLARRIEEAVRSGFAPTPNDEFDEAE